MEPILKGRKKKQEEEMIRQRIMNPRIDPRMEQDFYRKHMGRETGKIF